LKNKIYFQFSNDEDLKIFEVLKDEKDLNIFIDEADFLLSKKRTNEVLRWMIKYTREQNINFILIFRRPVEVITDILSFTDLFIIFQLSNIRDLDYLKNSLSLDKEIIEKIIDLEQFNFILLGDIEALLNL
jgi:hypothetical protein